MKPRLGWLSLFLAFSSLAFGASARRVVILAGKMSPGHARGEHEHRADARLMARCLRGVEGLEVEVYTDGEPANPDALDGADAIIVFGNGAAGHPLFVGSREAKIRALMAKGVGLGLVHWSIEAPKGKEDDLLDWVGGAFELNYSVNPHWQAHFTALPDHPVTRGVHPFSTLDEWTFNQRFRGEGVTPILVAVPPASALSRPDGPRSGNAAVRAAVAKHEPQTLMWVDERKDGGRGFGFAGGHFHAQWADDNERKLLLNAMVWVAHGVVPAGGIESRVTAADVEADQDGRERPAGAATKNATRASRLRGSPGARELVFLAGATPSY